MSTRSWGPQPTTFLETYTSRVIAACSKPPPARSLPTPVYSCSSPKFPLSLRCPRSCQTPDGSVGLRDKAGTSFTVRTTPSGLNQAGWAVPSRMPPSPQNKPADWRVSWAHWYFFSLSPHVSHSFPNWGSRVVTVNLLSIKSNPDGMIY